MTVYNQIFIGLFFGYFVFTIKKQRAVGTFLLLLIVGELKAFVRRLIDRVIHPSVRDCYPALKIAVLSQHIFVNRQLLCGAVGRYRAVPYVAAAFNYIILLFSR